MRGIFAALPAADARKCLSRAASACTARLEATPPRRSHLFRRTTSLCAICALAVSSSLRMAAPSGSAESWSKDAASTTEITVSRWVAKARSSKHSRVASTGPGSQIPLVSMATKSSSLACLLRTLLSWPARSALTSQHMQPLSSVTTLASSRAPCQRTRLPSMSTAPNSLTKTTARSPSRLRRMWFSNVVFPAPRKPVRRHTGSPGRSIIH
mmetsp:Transcript_5763/g.10309  ORF Transcript_5763/g.10309 Transcript_5763/m.10309 type:complete len:211 (-) Transcript_5763:56-688(-)